MKSRLKAILNCELGINSMNNCMTDFLFNRMQQQTLPTWAQLIYCSIVTAYWTHSYLCFNKVQTAALCALLPPDSLTFTQCRTHSCLRGRQINTCMIKKKKKKKNQHKGSHSAADKAMWKVWGAGSHWRGCDRGRDDEWVLLLLTFHRSFPQSRRFTLLSSRRQQHDGTKKKKKNNKHVEPSEELLRRKRSAFPQPLSEKVFTNATGLGRFISSDYD